LQTNRKKISQKSTSAPSVVPNQVEKLETQDHLPCRPKYEQQTPNHSWSPELALGAQGACCTPAREGAEAFGWGLRLMSGADAR